MKLFLDTANVDEIRRGNDWGILDGVTTNPTVVAKTGRAYPEVVLEICSIVDGPISAETVSLDCDGIIREARDLAALHPNVIVKVPIMAEGLKAVKLLAEEGIRTNVTVTFQQAALEGADCCTMPFDVMEQLFKHPMTDLGIETFLKDAAKIPKPQPVRTA